MDFLSKKIIFKDKNTTVTKMTDVLTGDFFYIVFSNLLGDFKKNLLKDIQGLEEKEALKIINARTKT
jgi:hypothetical protein